VYRKLHSEANTRANRQASARELPWLDTPVAGCGKWVAGVGMGFAHYVLAPSVPQALRAPSGVYFFPPERYFIDSYIDP
jgi:hypothetical protein